jgi:magnesium-transporting ATPase (P-type)
LETSTLDGEKHLKPRLADKQTQSAIQITLLDKKIVKK